MPIYEYECPNCGRFEVLERVAEAATGKAIKCKTPGCAKKAKRVISAPSFHLKGSGWYKTDYASSNGASSNGASSNGSSGSNGSKSSGESSSAKAEGSSGSDSKPKEKKGKCGSTCGCD